MLYRIFKTTREHSRAMPVGAYRVGDDWFIRIDALTQLNDIARDCDIIISFENKEVPTIEIYNDYRE